MDSLKIVDQAILELIKEYKQRKNYFFSEREIHTIFYCKLTALGDLVHPEYITKKRFKRIRGKKLMKDTQTACTVLNLPLN